tara:strand:+ start:366 stop:1151 length:786 start_codon:yes stop_codon:yes gene_type:complete
MSSTIEHNIDNVVKQLDIYQKSVLPKAAKTALNTMVYYLAKKYVPNYMRQVFRAPVNWTLKSVHYKVISSYEAKLYIAPPRGNDASKGNDPAYYLNPVLKEGGGQPAYETRFPRFVQKAGITSMYPIPIKENVNKPSHYSTVKTKLLKSRIKPFRKKDLDKSLTFGNEPRRMVGVRRGDFVRYFSVPDNRSVSSLGRHGGKNPLSDGIYRIKGNDPKTLTKMFAYSPTVPRVPPIFDYSGFVRLVVDRSFDALLREQLRNA